MSDLRFAIHPAIGIARIGNSPEYYFAPEVPDFIPEPGTEFKDTSGAVRKQAARFRVFRLDEGKPAVEVTDDGKTKIEWRVHLANRKSAWYEFHGAMDLGAGLSKPVPRRNTKFSGAERRELLVIDGGRCSVQGANQRTPVVGRFVDRSVFLGEVRTDESGRLVVLGGNGKSESLDGTDPLDDSNNDGWYDDTADGTVRASISYGGKKYEADPAFVAVAPPNYCQGISPVVSMYDVLVELFEPDPSPVLFWRDIYPIFERLVRCQWVSEGVYMLLGVHSPADLTDKRWQEILSEPKNRYRKERERIFHWFRNPDSRGRDGAALPPFYGDGYDYPQLGSYDLSLTRRQYQCLRKWAAGEFKSGPRREEHKMPTAGQTDRLDRAALEDCLGGPFHPGIELPWILRHQSMWASPFRLKLADERQPVRDDFGEYLTSAACQSDPGPLSVSGPGSITRWMAVPWQTDAVSCHGGYVSGTYLPLPSFWAARVPNFVVSEQGYKRILQDNVPTSQKVKHFSRRQIWFRDITGGSYNDRLKNSIQAWDKLGIVAPRSGPRKSDLPQQMWVETQRSSGGQADPTLDLIKLLEDGPRD